MPLSWEPGTARYRDSTTGRFVSSETVRTAINESIQGSESAVSVLNEALLSRSVNVDDWYLLFKDELKHEYIRQYVAGRGGLRVMTSEDWGSVGGSFAEQLRYLEAWRSSLTDAELENLSLASLNQRAGMYINSSREAFERGHLRAAFAADMTEERWVLGAAEHCDDCTELASRNWVSIGTLGTFPGAGETECLTNCKCHLDYR